MGSSCGTSMARQRPTIKRTRGSHESALYVHVAEAHPRELPEHVRDAASSETDPDRRILSMLGARGKTVAKTQATETEAKRSA